MTEEGATVHDDESRNENHATSSADGVVQTNLCNWLV